MATAGYRTIEVGHYDAGPKKEAIASGAITPGMLLERTNAATLTVKAHATAGGKHQKLFAVEDDLQGKEISEAYATTNRVFFRNFRSGDEVYALLANGQNISIGDFLMSDGAGSLKAYSVNTVAITGTVDDDSSGAVPISATGVITETFPVAVALEAVDLSDSSGADPATRRILVEVL